MIYTQDVARIHSHDLGSEKPHGVFERNKPEARVDLHSKEEEHFAEHVARILNEAADKKEYQHLTLIAAPKFLGNLRHKLKKHTSELVTKEVNKDLTHMDEQELKTYIWD
jgi:protein required for attachment to host cells